MGAEAPLAQDVEDSLEANITSLAESSHLVSCISCLIRGEVKAVGPLFFKCFRRIPSVRYSGRLRAGCVHIFKYSLVLLQSSATCVLGRRKRFLREVLFL